MPLGRQRRLQVSPLLPAPRQRCRTMPGPRCSTCPSASQRCPSRRWRWVPLRLLLLGVLPLQLRLPPASIPSRAGGTGVFQLQPGERSAHSARGRVHRGRPGAHPAASASAVRSFFNSSEHRGAACAAAAFAPTASSGIATAAAARTRDSGRTQHAISAWCPSQPVAVRGHLPAQPGHLRGGDRDPSLHLWNQSLLAATQKLTRPLIG